jgi:hypothetical protein
MRLSLQARSLAADFLQLRNCPRTVIDMGALAGLWNSEKGLVSVLALIAATVLAALSVLTSAQWIEFAEWTLAFYIGGKTAQGAVAAIASAMKPATTTVVATPGGTVATSEAAKTPEPTNA